MLEVGSEIAGAPLIAGDDHGLTARAQLGGQAQRREHVSAGAAGGEDDRPAQGAISAPGRRLVIARNIPMPSASAHNEEPP